MRIPKLILTAILFTSKTFAQVDTVSNLSDAEKVYGLSTFWSEAKYNFAYFDKTNINWDSAYRAYLPKVLATKNTWDYYNVLKRFCALLKDGHTNLYEPGSLYKTSRYKYINIENFNKKLYVVNIPVQYKDSVPLGSEVISVDGVPVADYLAANIFPFISASTEHQLWNDGARYLFYATDTAVHWNLELKTPEGKTIHHIAEFHTCPAKWVRPQSQPWKRFDFKMQDGVAIVTLNTFGDDKIIDDFKAVLPQLYTAKAVIIDIRDNGGGSSGIGAEILKYFTDEKVLTGSTWRTRDHLGAFKAWGEFYKKQNQDSLGDFEKKAVLVAKGEYWYKGDTMTFENDIKDKKITVPLVVLFGNRTASAAEDFLIVLASLPGRATTIGQRSYGSTGQPLPFDLPGGGSARICTKRDTYPDGKEFVGYGVKPDIEIPRNVNDVLNGTDTEMKAALDKLGVKK